MGGAVEEGPGGAVLAACPVAIGGAGGEILAVRGRGEDKGGVGELLDKVGCQGEHAVGDQNLAAPSGCLHADCGIARACQEWHGCVSHTQGLKIGNPFATR